MFIDMNNMTQISDISLSKLAENNITYSPDVTLAYNDVTTRSDAHARVENMTFRYMLILTVAVYLPLLVFGLIGNGLSFALIFRRMRSGSTYFYLASLCVFDSLFLLASVTPWSVYALSHGSLDMRQIIDCNFVTLMIIVPQHCSAWVLVIISLERLLVVYFPTRGREICDVTRARGIIAGVLVFVCLANWNLFGGYITIREQEAGDTKGKVCIPRSPALQYYYTNILGWVRATIYSYLPSSVLAASNTAIIVKCMRASSVSPQQEAGRSSTTVTTASRTMAKNSRRLTFIGLVLTSAFLLLTLPHTINDIYFRLHAEQLRQNLERYNFQMLINQILSCLYHLNHAINFVLYCVSSGSFRKELLKLVSSCVRTASANGQNGTGNNIELPRIENNPNGIVTLDTRSSEDKPATENNGH